jgi:hypothetical protein
MKKRRVTAAEVIATHYLMDLAEMKEYRYQPTRYTNPAIYSLGPTDYCAAPASGKMPPRYCDMDWQPDGEALGRVIWIGIQDNG